VNLQLKLARVSAVVLLLLGASPCTGPYAVCDLADAAHSHHAASRHLTHTSAVVRPAATVARQPILVSLDATPAVPFRHPSDDDGPTTAPPPLPARHLVLRL
jgi:hypothetical protein